MSDKTREDAVFEEGGIWEDSEWYVKFDYEGEAAYEHMCKHCSPTYDVPTGLEYKPYKTMFRCPRVVVATNEGGWNNTGVCLDCILEAAATL